MKTVEQHCAARNERTSSATLISFQPDLKWGYQHKSFDKQYAYDLSVETYSQTCQTSKMELFAEIVNGRNPLTTFIKSSVLDA